MPIMDEFPDATEQLGITTTAEQPVITTTAEQPVITTPAEHPDNTVTGHPSGTLLFERLSLTSTWCIPTEHGYDKGRHHQFFRVYGEIIDGELVFHTQRTYTHTGRPTVRDRQTYTEAEYTALHPSLWKERGLFPNEKFSIEMPGHNPFSSYKVGGSAICEPDGTLKLDEIRKICTPARSSYNIMRQVVLWLGMYTLFRAFRM